MKVAIIGGSGKMGQWFVRFLREEGKEVIITGRNKTKLREAGKRLGVGTATNIKAVKQADLVLLSVPIDNFEDVVRELGPYFQPNQSIIDLTSVKVMPMKVMHKYIKMGVVLGAHPVFGPGAKSVDNQNFVLTPTNDKERVLAQKAKQFLETRGGRVSLMTPREHDELMAVVLGLAHFVGIIAADTLLNFSQLNEMESVSGSTYKLLLMLAKSVITEDPELYASIQMSLPGMPQIHRLFRQTTKSWADIVKSKDRQGFVSRMNGIRDRLEKADPHFRRAYNDMYKLLEK
ncbi:MAG: prephenate dehydrogenase [Chloroflexota bacterium]